MTQFPSLLTLESTYSNINKITRNRKKVIVADFLYEWKSEDEPDDYFEMRNIRGYYTLNYQVITHLLCNPIEEIQLPEDTLEYMKGYNIDEKDFLCGQLKNMRLLIEALANKLPSCSEVIGRQSGLVLYRGFNYNRYKPILQRMSEQSGVGSIITTETFLSTSLQELTAINYIYSKPHKPEHNILWKIIVDAKYFDEFNYAFLSNTFHTGDDDIQTLYTRDNICCEFLLNVGALLQCDAVDVITDFEGAKIKGEYKRDYIISKKTYTQYTFRFVGWNKEYMWNIDMILAKQMKHLRKSKSKRN
uniref:Uncharacterized protein n=1 Tax=viral metagenome TaxID=1070528 RepID=A0A6C0LLK7_9ZZZZ